MKKATLFIEKSQARIELILSLASKEHGGGLMTPQDVLKKMEHSVYMTNEISSWIRFQGLESWSNEVLRGFRLPLTWQLGLAEDKRQARLLMQNKQIQAETLAFIWENYQICDLRNEQYPKELLLKIMNDDKLTTIQALSHPSFQSIQGPEFFESHLNARGLSELISISVKCQPSAIILAYLLKRLVREGVPSFISEESLSAFFAQLHVAQKLTFDICAQIKESTQLLANHQLLGKSIVRAMEGSDQEFWLSWCIHLLGFQNWMIQYSSCPESRLLSAFESEGKAVYSLLLKNPKCPSVIYEVIWHQVWEADAPLSENSPVGIKHSFYQDFSADVQLEELRKLTMLSPNWGKREFGLISQFIHNEMTFQWESVLAFLIVHRADCPARHLSMLWNQGAGCRHSIVSLSPSVTGSRMLVNRIMRDGGELLQMNLVGNEAFSSASVAQYLRQRLGPVSLSTISQRADVCRIFELLTNEELERIFVYKQNQSAVQFIPIRRITQFGLLRELVLTLGLKKLQSS